MSLAGILHGLAQAAFTVPVVGVVVGADPVKRLDKWAPKHWRNLCQLVQAGIDFHKPAVSSRARATIEQQRARIDELEQELETARDSSDAETLLAEACTALTACFKSLGSDTADIKDLLGPELFAYWQRRGGE
jgi:hypothetical protein